MFTCIACTKVDGGEEVEARGGIPTNTKDAVKGLTAQIKDMALKFSGAYRQCKPCTGSSSLKKGDRSYADSDAASEGIPYPYSTTPGWEFTSSGQRQHRTTSRLYTGDQTPGAESISAQSCDVVLEDQDQPKEWMAQVEPGVNITFVSLPNGGNELRRIRFSREVFDKWQAQRWWGENYDRIMELYNVQRFNRQALQTPSRSEDGRDSSFSRLEPARESLHKEWTPRHHYFDSQHSNAGSSAQTPFDAARTTTSSRGEPSISNASEMESEWIEEDEPGVYITIRQLVDGTRELRRVRFSREKFGEVHAKQWWDQNKDRIQAQYL